jgi:hypothetical protein
MRVEVKLVVFFQENIHEEGPYCGYCPALRAFFAAKTFNDVVNYMRGRLIRELEHRVHYANLKKLGWQVSRNSAKPPIFADEEVVRHIEQHYEVAIKEPMIIKVDVELPKARDRYQHLSDTHKDI